jgi:cell division protein FtsX
MSDRKRPRRDRELDEELRFHLEMEADKLRQQGLDEREARRRASLTLGGLEQVKEAVRDEWRWHAVKTLLQDARHAIRSLVRSPAYTLAALLTLALGIGANSAIFSLVNGVLLRPLPYRDGERLVLLEASESRTGDVVPFSIPEVFEVREQSPSLETVVEHHSMTFTLLGRDEPERVSTGVVSAEYFDALGVEPVQGRTFRAEDDDLGAEAVLVLANGYWRRSFGGDTEIVGRVFEMNDRPHTVIGVLPPMPQFPVEHDVYMPTSACPFRAAAERNADSNRNAFRALTAFARLAPAASVESAAAELETFADRLRADHPDVYDDDDGYAVGAVPLRRALTDGARPTLLVLLGATGLVLLLACTNVANLTLARLLRRDRELAIRSALGASRWRLAQQTLVEGLVLALAGGALGLLLAYAGLDLLIAFVGRFTPRAVDVGLDASVLLFTLIVALTTALAFGGLPARGPGMLSSIPSASRIGRRSGRSFRDTLLGARTSLVQSLREGGATTSGRRHQRFRAALISAQVALAVVLLVGAGLMLRSVERLASVDPGFSTESVLTARLTHNWSKYSTTEEASRFFSALFERLVAVPGVLYVGAGSQRPLDGQPPFLSALQVERQPIEEGTIQPQAALRVASPHYFRAMGIPLLEGRELDQRDDLEGVQVTVVNRAFADAFFPDGSPLERRLSLDGGESWRVIVGVVGDVRQVALDGEPEAAVYLPLAQSFWGSSLAIHARIEPAALIGQIKAAVHAIDPEQPVDDFETLAQTRREAMAPPRVTAGLLAAFAGLALVITAAGISGVIAYSVSQRLHEIGLRMALGAARSQVVLMVLRQGLVLVGVGLAVGLAVALALGRSLRALLYQTSPFDPLTLAVVVVVLVLTAAVSCLLPARRATAVDPTVALRSE